MLLELLFGNAVSKLHGIKEGAIAHEKLIADPLTRGEFYVVGRALARYTGAKDVDADRIARVLWFAPRYVPAACSCWYVANAKGLPVALYSPASDRNN